MVWPLVTIHRAIYADIHWRTQSKRHSEAQTRSHLTDYGNSDIIVADCVPLRRLWLNSGVQHMRDSLKIWPPPKGFALQLVLVLFMTALIGGGIYVGSFASHFIWVLTTRETVHTAQDSPAWLVIPSFAIGCGLFFLIARCLKLMQRFLKACQRK